MRGVVAMPKKSVHISLEEIYRAKGVIDAFLYGYLEPVFS